MIARRRCLLALGPQIPSTVMSAQAVQRFTGWQKAAETATPRWLFTWVVTARATISICRCGMLSLAGAP